MINIAIDGTAGSGKSALAKGIAKALNIKRLNTGEIYRAIACEYLSKIGENLDNKNVSLFCQNLKIEVLFKDERQITLVNGNDHTKSLREEKTSIFTAQIAKFKEIRQKVLAIQRDFAKKYDCVMEGRDIGREVLPNAQIKIFLTAKEEIRAKRRFFDIKDENITFEEVLEDLKKRDYEDSNREIAPLKISDDGVLVDNSQMNLTQTIDYCLKLIKDRINWIIFLNIN